MVRIMVNNGQNNIHFSGCRAIKPLSAVVSPWAGDQQDIEKRKAIAEEVVSCFSFLLNKSHADKDGKNPETQ